jgi:hypothetical protein
MIAKQEKQQQDKEECHFLCTRLAKYEIIITDDYGEYLADVRVCETCHEMLDHFSRFKWKSINGDNQNQNDN